MTSKRPQPRTYTFDIASGNISRPKDRFPFLFSRSGKFGIAASLLACWVVSTSQSAPPDWWSFPYTRILAEGTVASNYAPLNLGQLKHVAAQAKRHFDVELAGQGGAGEAINTLVAGFEPRPSQSYTPSQVASLRAANYAPATIGQLKAVAKPFYDRLIAVGYNTRQGLINHGYPLSWPHPYPWNPNLPHNHVGPGDKSLNYAPANIGQLKLVFSFEVSGSDGDADGLSDAWELVLGTNPFSEDSDGDGVTDGADALPLDSASTTAGNNVNGPPVIVTLTSPPGAVLQP